MNEIKTIPEQHFAAMRAAVDQGDDELDMFKVAQRRCDNCGVQLMLGFGRHQRKWFWTHIRITNCVYDATRCSVRFETEREAREATVLFKEEITNQTTDEDQNNQSSAA